MDKNYMAFNRPGSSYEEKVRQLLDEGLQPSYFYKREVVLPDLYGTHKNPLRFDFGIYHDLWPNMVALEYLIEVDGEFHFHFRKSGTFNTKLDFVRQKGYDEKKNSYCLAHHIPLIRIPYWEIQDLTFDKIFNTPYFVVKNKYHNSLLTIPS